MDEATHSTASPMMPQGDSSLWAPVSPASSAPTAITGPSGSPRASSPPREAARRSSALWILLFLFAVVLAGPYLVGRFIYQSTYNELRAGYDVATSTLDNLKPRLNDLELASRLVAKRVEPSVVSIIRPGRRGITGQGSGVIVDKAGYIVTNSHVVEGAKSVQVRLSDSRTADASVVGADAMMDIAVLKIDLNNLIAAEWGDSDKLQVGDLVWALGSPYGLERSLTFGIVSAKSRRSSSHVGASIYQEYLQTDAAVNPGNSGGPLVNIEGQVVGINAAIFGNTYQGISFSIPSILARERYEQLKAHGHIDRAWLGIMPLEVPSAIRQELGLNQGEGVLVGEVEIGAPANKAGLQIGDVILKWNEHVATDPTLLSRAIAATQIGSEAKLLLVRAGGGANQQITLDVRVEAHPDN
jgi:serine protease Do